MLILALTNISVVVSLSTLLVPPGRRSAPRRGGPAPGGSEPRCACRYSARTTGYSSSDRPSSPRRRRCRGRPVRSHGWGRPSGVSTCVTGSTASAAPHAVPTGPRFPSHPSVPVVRSVPPVVGGAVSCALPFASSRHERPSRFLGAGAPPKAFGVRFNPGGAGSRSASRGSVPAGPGLTAPGYSDGFAVSDGSPAVGTHHDRRTSSG